MKEPINTIYFECNSNHDVHMVKVFEDEYTIDILGEKGLTGKVKKETVKNLFPNKSDYDLTQKDWDWLRMEHSYNFPEYI